MLIVIISDFLCIYKSDVFVPDMPFHHEKLCLVVCCLCLSFLLSHAHVSHLCYLLPGLPSCVFKPFSVFPPVPWAPCKSVQPCLPCQGSNSAKWNATTVRSFDCLHSVLESSLHAWGTAVKRKRESPWHHSFTYRSLNTVVQLLVFFQIIAIYTNMAFFWLCGNNDSL